jgi:hypothetical protein
VAAVMYPNPASDVVWLDHDGSVTSVQVVDAVGRCVREEDVILTHHLLSIGELPDGMYSVVFFDRAGQSERIQRFVKFDD